MSEERNLDLTSGDINMEPMMIRFRVVWNDKDPTVKYDDVSIIATPNERNWDSFKRELFSLSDYYDDGLVTYHDSDNDVIPIESQCEFDEVLRITTKRTQKCPKSPMPQMQLFVKPTSVPQYSESKKKSSVPFTSSTMADAVDRKVTDVGRDFIKTRSRKEAIFDAKQSEHLENAAPKWFTNYMKTMKEDIITEVSTRVTRSVIEALQKKHENQCDSAVAFHRCNHNSRRHHRNADKQRKKHSKSSVLQMPNCSEIMPQRCYNSSASNRRRGEKFSRKREDAGTPSRSACGSSEFSEPNPRAKKPRDSENVCDEMDTPYRRMIASGIRQMSFTPVDSIDLPEAPILKLSLANSSHSEDRAKDETKFMDNKLGGTPTANCTFEKRNKCNPENLVLSDSDNISIISDISHNSDLQRTSSAFRRTSGFTMIERTSLPVDSDDDLDLEITAEYTKNDPRNAIERTFLPVETDDDLDLEIAAGYAKNERRGRSKDDGATRDSSSFELLSESASPPLSIHIDDDHFSSDTKEIKEIDLNDNAIMKECKRKRCKMGPLIVDSKGKIYGCNAIESNDGPLGLTFESHTDKEKVKEGEKEDISTKKNNEKEKENERKEENFSTDKHNAENCNDAKAKPAATKIRGKPWGPWIVDENGHNYGRDPYCLRHSRHAKRHSGDVYHESTESFHSHTRLRTQNDFAECSAVSMCDDGDETLDTSEHYRTFVDRNANKGLGDTAPRKQACENTCRRGEDSTSEKTSNASRKRSSHRSASSKKNWNSCQNQGTKKSDNDVFNAVDPIHMKTLANDVVDPLHLLPDALVSGAVNVAASAYVAARLVYDKILTTQTRNSAGKSNHGG